MVTPAGYLHMRADNHQGYKDAVTGFRKNVPEYPFPILDPTHMVTIPIRNMTAPPNWPKAGLDGCRPALLTNDPYRLPVLDNLQPSKTIQPIFRRSAEAHSSEPQVNHQELILWLYYFRKS
jgi:hypothetical protein